MNGLLTSLAWAVMFSAAADKTQWSADYGESLAAARAARRPLLIVIDSANDSNPNVRAASTSAESPPAELLAHFQLCRVDASTEYGRQVAHAFGAQRFPYTAITDRTGRLIIYQNDQVLSAPAWRTLLAAHQDGIRPAASQPNPRICFT